ncbi:tetratricopeptide repeat protein [Neomoorella thermoacetica]|uniref:tetratricopeptide repeat protein n=1 Tax=Neomoorella thermoacetica TaxID=1525 RepID=UPI0030D126B9
MTDTRAFLLILDGDEKKVLKKLDRAGFEDVQLYFPLLPQPGGTKRTAWWAAAARLFNSLSAGTGNRFFYWGPSRFLSNFLHHLDAGREEAFVWSHWERVPAEGVSRFYGALGAYLPEEAASVTLPTHLGNRFFANLLEEELVKAGTPLTHRGRPWPSPKEELATAKGSARLTLALIAKDEEEFLAGCLEQALPYVNDIVVVDTGSHDRTVEIAMAYGAKVIEYEWSNDFAAARNVYLEEITDGWIVTLDADEYLTPEAGIALRRLAEKGEPKVYYLRTYNYHNEIVPHFSDQANIRMIWRAEDLRYTGKIHEQLQTSLPRELFGGPIVLHYGYLPSVSQRKGKLVRNAGILDETTKEGTAFDWYNKGLNLMAMNKPAEALEALEKYLAMEAPESAQYRPSVYWHAARAALACGRQEVALEYAEKACQVPMPECYFTKGQILEALGRTDEAIAAYREAASLPDPPASIFQLFNQSDSTIKLWRAGIAAAALLEKEKRYTEAEQEYRKVLQGDMANLPALVGLARVKRLQGRCREGLKWSRRAVEIGPQALEAHVEYIECLLQEGELAAAWDHLHASELPEGLRYDLYLRFGDVAVDKENFSLALAAAEEALKADSGSVPAIVLKARSLKELGRLEEAAEILENAPVHPEIENERGCLALARGALDEAEGYFRQVLAEDPDHAAAATNLAQVLVLKGKVEEALAVVYPLATLNRKQPSIRAMLLAARCLNSLQRYLEALNLLSFIETGGMKSKELVEWHLVRGNAYFGLEDWNMAADCYFEAYSLNPNDPELLYRIGLLMVKLERWEDAENAFAGVLRFEPGNKDACTLLEIARNMRALGVRWKEL